MLRDNYEAGRLNLEEFQERIEKAYVAKTFGDLDQLTADLPAQRHVSQSPEPQRARQMDAIRVLAMRFLVISVFFIAIWLFSGGHGSFWPIWPILFFGVILALGAFGSPPRSRPADPRARRRRDGE